MELYLSSSSDYSIKDQDGKPYTPEEARALWESQQVTDFNLAFKRLVQNDFNVEAVKQHYAEGGR